MTDLLSQYVGCVFVAPSFYSLPGCMYGAATGFLLDTGQKRLLITCSHVMEDFRAHLKSAPTTILGINLGNGTKTIHLSNPDRHVLSENLQPLDLVVLEYEGLDAPEISERKYFKRSNSPDLEVRAGDTIVVFGFPGSLRTNDGGIYVSFVACPLPLRVSDTSERGILCGSTGGNHEVFADMANSFGGYSGAPGFLVGSNGELTLIGFVREWAPSLAGGALFLTPSKVLNKEGILSAF